MVQTPDTQDPNGTRPHTRHHTSFKKSSLFLWQMLENSHACWCLEKTILIQWLLCNYVVCFFLSCNLCIVLTHFTQTPMSSAHPLPWACPPCLPVSHMAFQEYTSLTYFLCQTNQVQHFRPYVSPSRETGVGKWTARISACTSSCDIVFAPQWAVFTLY